MLPCNLDALSIKIDLGQDVKYIYLLMYVILPQNFFISTFLWAEKHKNVPH